MYIITIKYIDIIIIMPLFIFLLYLISKNLKRLNSVKFIILNLNRLNKLSKYLFKITF